MKHRLLAACFLTGLLTPALASANPEPTAYDTKSVGMALTGTTYLERPAALALNPANMEGIKKLGFTFNMTNLLVNQTAPVQGPNTSVARLRAASLWLHRWSNRPEGRLGRRALHRNRVRIFV